MDEKIKKAFSKVEKTEKKEKGKLLKADKKMDAKMAACEKGKKMAKKK